MANPVSLIPYHSIIYSDKEIRSRSREFYLWLNKRRTVRDFSERPVEKSLIENLILTASTAPSGAHKQPWMFCAVSDPEIKKEIRKKAEAEEYRNYHGRMPEQWLRDLAPLGTDWHKPFLETAPWLIIVFKKIYDEVEGEKRNNYYVSESVGLACGFLLAAIHNAGLVALTHTPSPMNFLSKILERPANEKPFLLIPVGYPLTECLVPDLKRKPLEEVSKFY